MKGEQANSIVVLVFIVHLFGCRVSFVWAVCTVMVEWQIFQYNSTDSLQSIPSQQDFSAVAGVLQFAPSVSEQSIQLDLLRDGLPELEEMFAGLIRTTGAHQELALVHLPPQT